MDIVPQYEDWDMFETEKNKFEIRFCIYQNGKVIKINEVLPQVFNDKNNALRKLDEKKERLGGDTKKVKKY